MSDFENKYLEKTRSIILKYINKDSIEVFLFGSRAIKTNSKYSDIDIGLLADKKIGRSIILKINHEIEESRIPFKVDIIDFFALDDKFKEIALKGRIIWNKKKS